MIHKIYPFLFLAMILVSCSTKNLKYSIDDDGTVHVPAYTLPESSFLSEASKEVLKKRREEVKKLSKEWSVVCPYPENPNAENITAYEECNRQHYYKTSLYLNAFERYKVDIEIDTLNGVYVEVFTPKEGIKKENTDHVIISLHSGAFLYGSRTASRVESAPISSIGGIKVVGVDYRMAPKHKFPAAGQDVAAVYKALLKEYKPENIGIYGYAAGGALTTQALALFQKENLPIPGAVGIICMAAAKPRPKSDSMHMISATLGYEGVAPTSVFEPYYGKNPDYEDPLLVPLKSEEVLSKFPPSLLIVSTRDFHLSSVVYTHTQLVKLGVEADLHVWEGLGHVFLEDTELAESREAYNVIVNFFNKHLK